MDAKAELILRNARISTLDPRNPQAAAVAIRGGRFVAVGDDERVMKLAGPGTRVVDANKRRVIPA